MSVYVCGDIHGTIDISKLSSKNWPEKKELSKTDILIQLGDFGLIWDGLPSATEEYWMKWFDDQPYTTLFVPGNHENWDRLLGYPEVDLVKGKARTITDSIYMLERAGVYEIQGKKFFSFGGAHSIDKAHRIQGQSWWPQEVHDFQDTENALDAIEKNEYFDFVVTHTCPQDVANMLVMGKAIECPTSRLFSHLAGIMKFGEWHFGHFHKDRKIGKFSCHYNAKPVRII